ncbi:carbohydrate kinase family protein [uncultured Aeromicrobium sp.]|uniref:carbohydrate kinase family protein n=1 Tax=uncultured Aeromicrobium sp. TaxID=337820 RepID=UPI0025D38613|nr:carbohydrate kinase family protein [uncultured Aeromicrobium sp.]
MTSAKGRAARQPARPDILVISRIVLDQFADTGRVTLGGSGFWAAFGAAIIADAVQIASRVGDDLDSWRDALIRLGIGTDALIRVNSATSRTLISYPQPERRVERPLPDWAAHVRMRTMLNDVPEPLRSPRAYYVFRDHHRGFWPPLLRHAERLGVPLMWELPPTVCTPGLDAPTREVLARTTIVSLNEAEARSIFGDIDPVAAVAALRDLGPQVVVLRRGGRGSIVAGEGQILRVGPAAVTVADPTGGGNAYSGAFLAARTTGRSLAEAARIATGAAACAIEQSGHPPDRATARARAAALATTVQINSLTGGDR